ncbi:Type II transport protein GspH [compost metagenome]
MAVIAIVAILASIGYPSFQTLIMNNRMTSQTNALLGAFQLARSEAVTQRQTITVCPSSDQATCSGNNWSLGVLVRRADASVVRVLPAATGNTVTGTASITFATDGSTANGGTLRICDSRGDSDSRTLLVNAGGQARSRTYQAGDAACPP